MVDLQLRIQRNRLVERAIQEAVVSRTRIVERILGLQSALFCVGKRNAGGEKIILGHRAEFKLPAREFRMCLQCPHV